MLKRKPHILLVPYFYSGALKHQSFMLSATICFMALLTVDLIE